MNSTPFSWLKYGQLIGLLFGVLLLVELLSWTGLCVVEKAWITPKKLSDERKEMHKASLEQLATIQQEPVGMFAREYVHPYVGFVERTNIPEDMQENDLINYGFGPGALIRKAEENEVVVGIFGGSVAYYFAQSDGLHAFWNELQKDPKYAGKTLRLMATGTPGFKQPQQLMTLNYLLSLGAHFDIIINIDGFNEVALPKADNINRGVFAFFPREWQRRVEYLDLDPEMRLISYRILNQSERRQWLAQIFDGPVIRKSMTASLVWKVLDTGTRWQLRRSTQAYLSLKGLSHHSYAATGPSEKYADDDALYDEMVAVWIRSSELMQNIADGIGALYIHVLQPNQYLRDSKLMSEAEKAVAMQENQPYAQAALLGYPKLINAGNQLRGEGIRYYDMTMVFQSTKDQTYKDSCCHYNELGNTILGEAIGRAMRAER
ncbi:hypothetical protein COU76_03860 [Candidatus Peregrinibacteria bacterium CG10_big_fil_rev_8_21_14_0_10_49_10]|nr:MAG: hypothetical protein COU76_03860 [Candidatus Peregrinibacteria bacterium CG10_big_fil_rev_8_21_14_0_10_49_10]